MTYGTTFIRAALEGNPDQVDLSYHSRPLLTCLNQPNSLGVVAP
jgi:hypothetical protein